MNLEHIKLAHKYWKDLLDPSDNVIDATCGNGKDTLFLSKLLPNGKIFCFDIQKKAIENTFSLLKENLEKDFTKRIFFINNSHEDFSSIEKSIPIKLIVYNLGYLPGGDKNITTKTSSTLESINNALKIITQDGAISITCYPHKEGLKEQEAILKFLESLNSPKYSICFHKWINKKNVPNLIWIRKSKFS